jgi:membrane-bound lytic murein transglycosylase D
MIGWGGIQLWLKRNAKFLLAVPGLFALVWLVKITSYSLSPEENKAEDPAYKIYGLNFPRDLNFAGEKVPGNDILVREAFDREMLVNTYWQSNALLMHKRANRWFPVIEPILKKHGIPDDFKYVAVVESGLTNSVSPQQATGYWQIIASTAEIYGLEVNDEVDERYNVELATEAACKYFKEAYRKFGNWTLVAASYNLGMGGLEGQMKRQKVSSYYDLLLNEETSRYVFRILAVKELISKPGDYGFKLRKRDLYPPIPTYKIYVDSSITDLADFAIKQGVNYKILKIFNPWLRKGSLSNPQKKKYAITLPRKEYLTSSFDEEITGAFDSVAPADSAGGHIYMGPVVNEADTAAEKPYVHVVREGESAAVIAKQYNIEEAKLRLWNKLADKEVLKPGRELVIFTEKNAKKK